MRRESGEVFTSRGYVPMSVACSAWQLPRTRRRRHEAFRLESQTPWTGRSENRVAVMPAMTEGQSEPTIAGCSPYRCRRCGGDMEDNGKLQGSAGWRYLSRPSPIMVSMSTGPR